MTIIWRNPKQVVPKNISVVNTDRVDGQDLVRLFYHCSSGLGILGTDFELLVNRNRRQQAA